MSDCELCGAKNGNMKARVEGAVLSVCEKCVSMGQEVATQTVRPVVRPKRSMPDELELNFKQDAPKIIRQAREKRGLNQVQLAEKISEKVSFVQRIEEGWTPPIATARKLEKFLGISLMESVEIGQFKAKSQKKQLTMGDVAEVIG